MDKELAHALLYDMSRRTPDKLVKFGQAMATADALGDDWWYFLDRAEKWASEYVAWANLDYPQEGDEGWHEWCSVLDATVEAS